MSFILPIFGVVSSSYVSRDSIFSKTCFFYGGNLWMKSILHLHFFVNILQ